MAPEHRSPEQIERDIAHEREGLERNLDELRGSLSPGAFVNRASSFFRDEGGDVGRAVTESVKRNPVGLMVTAAGLGLLALPARDWSRFGRGWRRREHVPDLEPHQLPEREAREGPAGGFDVPEPYSGPRSRVSGLAERPPASWETGPLHEEEVLVDPVAPLPPDVEPEPETEASGRGGGGRMARMRARMREQRGAQRERARRLRGRLAHGTERFSEESRNRVIAARHRAERAQHHVERMARRGGQDTASFYRAHPIVVGSAIVAAGALLGGLLPGTRREDARFGASRDRLFDEAERIFREERAKAGSVAEAAADEARKVGEEAVGEADRRTPEGSQAVDTAEQRVRSAAKRVAERAEDEAENQDMRHPRKP